jgi:hypothetical protein
MFAQIIQARTRDEEALRRRSEEWNRSLKSGAQGFLGSTQGVSDDGEFIVIARFESEDAASRNSDRPEQGEWWAGTQEHLEGAARFYDSTDVSTFLDGGSDSAGFVQIIQGTAKDRERLIELFQSEEDSIRENRPDVIGGFVVWQGNDFTQIVYFTSEDEARQGERSEGETGYEEWAGLVDNMKFIDLRRPVFSSP